MGLRRERKEERGKRKGERKRKIEWGKEKKKKSFYAKENEVRRALYSKQSMIVLNANARIVLQFWIN